MWQSPRPAFASGVQRPPIGNHIEGRNSSARTNLVDDSALQTTWSVGSQRPSSDFEFVRPTKRVPTSHESTTGQSGSSLTAVAGEPSQDNHMESLPALKCEMPHEWEDRQAEFQRCVHKSSFTQSMLLFASTRRQLQWIITVWINWIHNRFLPMSGKTCS